VTTWRDRFAPRIAHIIAKARVDGLDDRATMRALRNPYKGGWLAQLWSDERAKQLGRATGRIHRKDDPASRRAAVVKAGQLDLLGEDR